MKPWERPRTEAQAAVMPWQKQRTEPQRTTAHNPQPGDVLPLPGIVPQSAEQSGFQPSFDPRQMPSTGTSDEFSQNLGAIEATVDRYVPAVARTVGNNLLPSLVDPPTEDQGAMFDRMMIELLSTGAGAGTAGAISRTVQGLGRGFLRGGTKHGSERWLRDNAQHVVPSGSPATASLAANLARPAAVGVGTEIVVDWSDPATSDFWDKLISIPAGIGAAGVAGQEARANLLLQHPKFREIAMKASRAGVSSKVIGGLVGYALSQLYPKDATDERNPVVDRGADRAAPDLLGR